MADGEEFQSESFNLEQRVLKGPVAVTYRDIQQYSDELNFKTTDQFIDYIRGKKVLDLGSGFGGLAKDAKSKNINTQIYSLDPKLSLKKIRDYEKKKLDENRASLTPKQLTESQSAHDATAAAAFGHRLPFKEDSFDVILDNWAATSYMHPKRDLNVYIKTIQEMLRVVKPGGKIRIKDSVGYGPADKRESDPITLKEQFLKDQSYEYRLIEDETGIVQGVEITKRI